MAGGGGRRTHDLVPLLLVAERANKITQLSSAAVRACYGGLEEGDGKLKQDVLPAFYFRRLHTRSRLEVQQYAPTHPTAAASFTTHRERKHKMPHIHRYFRWSWKSLKIVHTPGASGGSSHPPPGIILLAKRSLISA